MPGFSFKKQNGTDDATNLTDIKVIIYEDGSTNKYTFGVDTGNAFDTFKYESGSNGAVDYSALAKEFMKGGGVSTLLGKLMTIDTNVGAINTKVGTIETAVGNAPLAPMFTGLAQQATLATLDGKVDAINTNVGNSPLAGRFTGLAQQTTLTALDGKVDAINTNVGNAPLAPMFTGLAQQATLATLDGKVDAINTNVGNSPLAGRFTGLAQEATLATLGTKVTGITNLIPANLTDRLNALNPDASNPASLLGATLKEIKDKTDKLDPTATTAGTLGKVLSELAKANQLPDNLTKRLDALDPASTDAGTLGKVLSELAKSTELTLLAKANQLPADLAARLDALNDPTDNNPGTLGEALEAIQLETGSMSTNLQLLTALLKGQLGTSSAGNNEDMLGKYSHDQFLV